MHLFHYINNELYCEKKSVQRIAGKIETPFYLYSKNSLLENFSQTDAAFGDLDHTVCYALKANSNETLLSLLAEQGAGADAVSGGEIYLALKNGFKPENIVYAGVGKTDAEIKYALAENIYSFHVESVQELQVINEIAQSMGKVARVGIRVNPNIDIHGHPYISTGRSQDKFGIELQEVELIFSKMDHFTNIRLIGLHFHNGSQISEITPYRKTIEIANTLQSLLKKSNIKLQYIDIGGGVAVSYENVFQDTSRILSAELIKTIRNDLESLRCKIIFEPGRSLIAEAGCLVTKVLFNKDTSGKKFLIVDASMTDLIRPSLYQAYHEIVPLKMTHVSKATYDVVGPVCESGDFFARERQLPQMKRGEHLAIMTSGAYGFSLSSNYNARLRPAEILVDGEEYFVIRDRGKVENLWG